MPQAHRLGASGLTVPAVGLGCMGMSEFYGPTNEGQSIATIHRALELGVGLFDDVVPIPGTKRPRYVEENVAAAEVELSAEDLRRLERPCRSVPRPGNATHPPACPT